MPEGLNLPPSHALAAPRTATRPRALFKRERCGADELGNVYIRKLERNAEGEEVERRYVKYGREIDPT